MTGMVAALDGVHVEMNTGERIRKLADVRAGHQSLPAACSSAATLAHLAAGGGRQHL